MAWRFATSPTRRSPFLLIATIEGVVRAPSALGITTGSPASMTATHEFVVPRSIPITFGTFASYYIYINRLYYFKIRRLLPAVHSSPASCSVPQQYHNYNACGKKQTLPESRKFRPH